MECQVKNTQVVNVKFRSVRVGTLKLSSETVLVLGMPKLLVVLECKVHSDCYKLIVFRS